LFAEAKSYSTELKELMNQEYDQIFQILTKNLNVKEFANIQRERVDRVVTIVEKAFVSNNSQSHGKESSRVKQEIWKMIPVELSKVQSAYEKFLNYFEDTVENNKSKGKRSLQSELKPWQALHLIIQKSAEERSQPEKEAFSVSDKKLYEFKLDYKLSKIFNPKVLEAFELIENYVKELNQIIQTLKEEQKLQSKEHELLSLEHNINNKRQETFREEVLNLVHGRNAANLKLEDNDPDKQQKALRKTIDELQDENLKFFNENQAYKKEVKELKRELKKTLLRLENQNGPKHDKDIMVDLYSPNTETHKTPTLLSYVKDPELCINASKLPKELCIAMINMILSDKQFTDLCDDYEGRPRKPLNKFLVEWFLKKFGLYKFSETLIQDFVLSIHGTVGGNRFRVFKLLLGMHDGGSEEEFLFDSDRSNQLDRQKLKKLCFGTTAIQKYYYKILKHIRVNCGTSLAPFFQQHSFGPFLADLDLNEDQLNVEIAKAVLSIFIKEENLSVDEARLIDEYFYLLVGQHQMSIKLTVGFDDYGTTKTTPNVQTIGLDMFIKFLLEVVVERKLRGIERYYTTMKGHIIAQNYADLSYDEFCSSVLKVNGDTTQTWRDHCFASLMTENIATKIPLHILMESFVDSYMNVDQVKSSTYQKNTDRENKQISYDEAYGQSSSRSHKKYKKGSVMRVAIPIPSSNNTLSSPTNATPTQRPRTLVSKKEALNSGIQALNEKGYELYDTASSLIVLQETYAILEDSVKEAEKENDMIASLHDEFLKDLEVLPKKLSATKRFDELLIFGKEELVDYLESLWFKLRGIMIYIFRTN